MATKEAILNGLSVEIDKMTQVYKHEITLLKKQIKALELEGQKKTSEIDSQITLEKQQSKYETIMGYFSNENANIPEKLVDYLFEVAADDLNDSLVLLELFQKSLAKDDLAIALYILNLLKQDPCSFILNHAEIDNIFEDILSHVFLNGSIESDDKYDNLLIGMLELLYALKNSSKEEFVANFLETLFHEVLDCILHVNNVQIIIYFFRICNEYNLRTELIEGFHHILKIEWEFLDSFIQEEDFVFLLWYAYLFDLDEKLLDLAVDSSRWFVQKNPELSLYFYLYDCISQTVIPNQFTYEREKSQFLLGNTLRLNEKEEIVAKTDSVIKRLMPKITVIPANFQGKTAETVKVDSNLKEKSELKLLGYQITGLTREKRWAILKKAVPKLGLSKVVYIIASNVRLRKGQKNGMVKFNHAITEWEYDLANLKRVYYKKSFKWPTY